MNIIHRIHNRLTKLRLQPIRVFCLHKISAKPEYPNEGISDWMAIKAFQTKVWQMQQSGVKFISLLHAYELLKVSSLFRRKKYAVLTFDDGYKSLDEILPWLIEQQIPVTLFICGKYTDGKEHIEGHYNPFHCLTADELKHCVEISNGLISIHSHGWEHTDATQMSTDEFRIQIENNLDILDSIMSSPMRGVSRVLFHAYTWGRHNAMTDQVLKEQSIIPVLMDGMKNYNDASCIHRELL